MARMNYNRPFGGYESGNYYRAMERAEEKAEQRAERKAEQAERKAENKIQAINKLNLGKHEKHDLDVILEPSGPHKGKIICKTCNGKFVTWIPKALL